MTLTSPYPGSGSPDDPYVVVFPERQDNEHDAQDPTKFHSWRQWSLCAIAGFLTFSVAFTSSAFASAIPSITSDFGATPTEATLGMSLFVLGFVFGPLIWAPASETFGRRHVFLASQAMHVLINIALCFSPNILTMLIGRFLSGSTGAAPLTNAPAVIADTFPPQTKSLAIMTCALVSLAAPVLGPMIGQSIAASMGWQGLMTSLAALSFASLLLIYFGLPETYAPIILETRARQLATETGKVYISTASQISDRKTFTSKLIYTLSQPFRIAVHEPAIQFIAIYQAVVFGVLYLLFAATPIIYGEIRHWPTAQIGLSFSGILPGLVLAIPFQVWDNSNYQRRIAIAVSHNQNGPSPEARLTGCYIGGPAISIGLITFVFAADPNIYGAVGVLAGVPFGFGIVVLTISTTNYVIDTFTRLTASALAVCICYRAALGAAFPLLARPLYDTLGMRLGLMIPVTVTVICIPLPFILGAYGERLRGTKKAGEWEPLLG